MGIMTFCAGTDGDWPMHELLLYKSAVMTFHTEPGLIFADVQQEPAISAMGLVTGKTVALLDRRMHDLLFIFSVMTFVTKSRHLGIQLVAFAVKDGVGLYLSHMTGKTIFVLDRGVEVFQSFYGFMTIGCKTVAGKSRRSDGKHCKEKTTAKKRRSPHITVLTESAGLKDFICFFSLRILSHSILPHY